MEVLVTNAPGVGNTRRPMSDQRIRVASPVRVALATAKRRIPRHGPSVRVVRIGVRAADVVDLAKHFLNAHRHQVAKALRVCDAQVGEGTQIEPDRDLASQPSPDFDVDQRVNW